MELSMLKDLFFVGEEQAIDEFIAGLKARCIKNGDIRVAVTPAGEERVLYNSENNTYFSQRMYVLKKRPSKRVFRSRRRLRGGPYCLYSAPSEERPRFTLCEHGERISESLK